MKRVLGIDPGERRVGLALSDPLGIIAQGLDTFDRNTGDLLDRIAALVHENDVDTVVVGNPISMSGRPSASSRSAQGLADQIRARVNIVVVLWDERLSSVEAGRVLAGEKRKKGSVDRVAAVLILQNYLDSRA